MLVFAPILILLLAAIILVLLAWLRPDFRYQWLLVTGSAFLAWIMVWIARASIPRSATVLDWGGRAFLPSSPTMVLDGISWPFVLSLTTLILAVFLTDVLRISIVDWRTWAAGLFISCLGIVAVMAGNIITVLISWTLLDVVELLVLTRLVQDPERQRGVFLFFATSVLGTMVTIFAAVLSLSQKIPLSFENILPGTAVLLIISAGMRLGVLPLQSPFLSEAGHQRGLGTVIKVATSAASLVFLVRVSQFEVLSASTTWFYLLLGTAGLYGAVSWARASDEIEGRNYWIVGMASMVIAAAVGSRPAAVMAWSLALIASGSLMFLFSLRQKQFYWLAGLGVLGISALPFTQAYAGTMLYSWPFHPLVIIFLFVQAILIVGYIRHSLRLDVTVEFPERWMWLVYPTGLALLPVSHWLGSSLFVTRVSEAPGAPFWPPLVVLLIGLGYWFAARRGIHIPSNILNILDNIFSLRWFYKTLETVFNRIGSGARLMTVLLEGQGGVLWALLILTLLLSLVGQTNVSAGG